MCLNIPSSNFVVNGKKKTLAVSKFCALLSVNTNITTLVRYNFKLLEIQELKSPRFYQWQVYLPLH